MEQNDRIIVIDDDPGIRQSYQELLGNQRNAPLADKGATLFKASAAVHSARSPAVYALTFARRGMEGVDAIRSSLKEGKPFAAAFIDMKMPGIDGAETTRLIWEVDPNIKIVIVTAYSEYTPDDIIRKVGRDDLFYLRKPFNSEEIRQFARVLSHEWNLEREQELLNRQLTDANRQLAEMNRNLRKQVESQTTLLVQSEKMASLGILAAGVAHEINNPMAYINGNLETLAKYHGRLLGFHDKFAALEQSMGSTGLRGKSKTAMAEIQEFRKTQKIGYILEDMVGLVEDSLEGVQRVKKIVQDLKTFSRIDETDFKAIDLNEAIDATLSMIRNEIKYKADVHKDYGPLPAVQCMAQKISQLFMNLLLNAAQALETRGTIRITTRKHAQGRRKADQGVQVVIADTGAGISRENLTRIYDPFFTTKPVGQGTGLGLSIVYDIIKAHSGTIVVESQPGQGTTFTIWLPVAPVAPATPIQKEAYTSPAAETMR